MIQMRTYTAGSHRSGSCSNYGRSVEVCSENNWKSFITFFLELERMMLIEISFEHLFGTGNGKAPLAWQPNARFSEQGKACTPSPILYRDHE